MWVGNERLVPTDLRDFLFSFFFTHKALTGFSFGLPSTCFATCYSLGAVAGHRLWTTTASTQFENRRGFSFFLSVVACFVSSDASPYFVGVCGFVATGFSPR